MSVGVNGFGVNVVYVKGLLESWATQPWKSFAAEVMVLVMCEVMRRRNEVFWRLDLKTSRIGWCLMKG
jgi:hypothetical protein